MKKIITFLLILSAFPAWATHLLGGYIQVKRVATSLTFEITVNLYMNDIAGQSSAEQTDPIPLCMGDGSGIRQVRRVAKIRITNEISLNTYQVQHTYNGTGSGSYTVSMQLPNRSLVNNLPNAIQTPLYLETTFSSTATNDLPVFQGPDFSNLTVPVNQKAVYNFQTTDIEGDSIAHYLIRLRNGECQKNSQQLSDYVFPNDVTRKGTFKIDMKTGQLTWDAPTQVGTYDFAIVAEEWRNGQRISATLFDLVTRVRDEPGSNPGLIPPYEPVLERGLLTALENRIDELNLSVTVAPNPSSSRFQVVLKSHKPTTATFQLLNSQGKIIQEVMTSKAALEHEQAIGSEQLAPGLYLIRTSALGRSYTNKVVKK
ncbi:T9SS type A sorting domain-containing protein [Larkinella rosea]|uniref:T9SS C-terminal target domain-containing protein n=1 Tax=Larkinella rosea TaxID=2025312 RepID=A0A3P1BD07_9BACT|nr:T9SS type A sorting domain-containing protein [Larkinella rosea]RRA98801.1 T9SS C-terminal target domain-containing protein [Larkinella rosea]